MFDGDTSEYYGGTYPSPGEKEYNVEEDNFGIKGKALYAYIVDGLCNEDISKLSELLSDYVKNKKYVDYVSDNKKVEDLLDNLYELLD